jgi:hypothetical protein
MMNSNEALLFYKQSIKVSPDSYRDLNGCEPACRSAGLREQALADCHIRFFKRMIKVRVIFYLHSSPALFKQLPVKVIFSSAVNSRLIRSQLKSIFFAGKAIRR